MDEIEIAALTNEQIQAILPKSVTTPKFTPMPKIGRLSRGCTITEKIDGTNASIFIAEPGEEYPDGLFLVSSRTRWITPSDDNYDFAKWAYANRDELMKLGPGHHFGEWWGLGIQRRYGLQEKRFSLFNVNRWRDGRDTRPTCCGVVPVLYEGDFNGGAIDSAMNALQVSGSVASPGFMQPEGIVIYHQATKTLFKKTFEKDSEGKAEGVNEEKV
jgi:hypothetical protein